MKTNKIVYWVFTGLLSAFMLFSGTMYLTKDPHMMETFQKLGYPSYFSTLLGIAKLLGAIALIQPKWRTIQEWAYAGFAFTFIGAAWSHYSMGESVIAPLIALIILYISYYFRSWLIKNKI